MRKYLLLLFIAGILVSCKKDDNSVAGLKEELTGKWNYGSLFQENYDANGKLTLSTRLLARNTDSFTFNANDSFTSTYNSRAQVTNGTYTLNSTSAFTLKTGNLNTACRIISLNRDTLIFVAEDPKVKGQPYVEYRHTLNK